MNECIDSRRIPFVWSLRRSREWKRCPRGCFFRCYAAQGGHEPGVGDRETERLHLLRALLSVPEYRRRTLNLEMRRRFYSAVDPDGPAPEEEEGPSSAPSSPAPLAAAVLRRFDREWRAMLLGLPSEDHRLPMLAELLDPRVVSFDGLRREIAAELAAEAEALEAGGWGELEALPVGERRPIDSPLFVDAGELRCCTVPLVALRRRGELWIVDGADPPPEEEPFTALLHRLWAMNRAATPPDRVRSFSLTPATGALREFGHSLEISATMRRLFADAAAMLEAVPADGKVKAADFPSAASPELCRGCVYRSFCGSAPASVTK